MGFFSLHVSSFLHIFVIPLSALRVAIMCVSKKNINFNEKNAHLSGNYQIRESKNHECVTECNLLKLKSISIFFGMWVI